MSLDKRTLIIIPTYNENENIKKIQSQPAQQCAPGQRLLVLIFLPHILRISWETGLWYFHGRFGSAGIRW